MYAKDGNMKQDKSFTLNVQAMLAQRPATIDKADRLWEAAVLVPLVYTKTGRVGILFEERSQHLHWQPGDVCFPGGKKERKDKTLQDTAVRETCEELGLSADKINICGELDYLVTHLGPILHPFVGTIEDLDDIKPNCSEVGDVFIVPLDELLAQEPRKIRMQLANRAPQDFPYDLLPSYPKEWNRRKGYDVYFYQYNKHVIWGMTARVLHGFLERIKKEI
jgi:8-oxo-dGTP pyrophosphatase MutT (NUDIX family)